jgi:hypothetical protein
MFFLCLLCPCSLSQSYSCANSLIIFCIQFSVLVRINIKGSYYWMDVDN